MKIITFYADCDLPAKPRSKQVGFDWHKAIAWLKASAEKQGYETVVVSDMATEIEADLRIGNAMESGLMLWILEAQAEAIRLADGPCVMVSPDSLVMGQLDAMFGDWDLTLLTRLKPKPIVNSVIAFHPSERLYALWLRMVEHAKHLPPDSLEWGADIDALVSYLRIYPSERGIREHEGVRVRFLPMESVFTSVERGTIRKPTTPIWDFKGARKRLMEQYVKCSR